MTIGERIKSLRKRHGLTQKEFAERISVSSRTICRYEKGEAKPAMKMVDRILQEFGESIIIGEATVEDAAAVAMKVYISTHLSTAALHEQLYEEAVELAKEAAKISRILRGENPARTTLEEASRRLIEEYADVQISADILGLSLDQATYDRKLERWYKLLKEAEDAKDKPEE